MFATSRHSPERNVLTGRGARASVRWHSEPAVLGHRRLTTTHLVDGSTVPVPVSASVAVVRGVGAVVASDDGYVRLWDPSFSRSYWKRRVDRSVYAGLVVDHEHERVLVASTSGLVCCLTLRGELSWAHPLDREVFATPVIDPRARIVHVATFDSECVALDLDSGTVRARVDVPRPWSAPSGLASSRDVYASPVVTPGSVAIVAAGEHVIAWTEHDGVLWSVDLDAGIKASPTLVLDGTAVVVCAVDGSCVLLDVADGSERRRVRLDGRLVASPVVSGPTVAVGVQEGSTYGLDTATLALAWTSARAPRSYSSYSVLPNGDFIMLERCGDIVALGRDDGTFRWQSSQVLGLPDHEPAMDVTPVTSDDGWMYGASYAGDLYAFGFRPA